MSQEAVAWCKQRGAVVSLFQKPIALKEVSPELTSKWEARYGKGIWGFREAWFKKPLALLQAPYERNCWLDLDCEVRGDLKPLFDCLKDTVYLAMMPEPEEVQEKDREEGDLLPGEVSYNSGVMVFRGHAQILHQWVEASRLYNGRFLGDQTVLSRQIYLQETAVHILPESFNWLRTKGPNSDALIIHYIQAWKLELLSQLGLMPK